MEKSRSSKSPNASRRRKNVKEPNFHKNDPFAAPPHPLGFRFLAETRPLRASKVGAILPSIIAKYGLGRRLGVERFQNAWRDALAAVFEGKNRDKSGSGAVGFAPGFSSGFDDVWDDSDLDNLENVARKNEDGVSSKLALYLQYARPQTFRGGTLSVRIASNLLYQELQFYLPALLKEIQAILPDENVERIKLVVR